jgi:toxin ParE1/3/4
MSYTLTILPEAEAEIVEASDWYDESSSIVRDKFISGMRKTLAFLLQQPFQYQIVYGKARRVMIERFPYALIYVVSDQDVYVVACIHSSRDPKRWQNRIR